MSSEKAKVIGISKVLIPTIRHPQVPYFVAVVEDENKNKFVYKTCSEAEVGQEIVFESNSDSNTVAIWRTKYDYVEAMGKALDLIGGINIGSDSKVLILPTLVSANQTYFRENTSPEFLTGILNLLKQKVKPENIKIAAQSFGELPIEVMAERSGLLKVCLQNNIAPIDLAKTNFVKQDKFEISEEISKADIVINLGMLKSGQAQATKNAFCVLKKENYLGLKYLQSEKEIAIDLGKQLLNMITLGEAEYIQKAEGYIVFLGLILASRNFMNLDVMLNEIVQQRNLPELLEGIQSETIPIAGRQVQEVQFDIKNI